MNSRKVILIDAGTGNLRSVYNALQKLGAQVMMVGEPAAIPPGERVILPGVGAFGRFMDGLDEHGLLPAIREAVARGDPLLGICVGMQALFEASDELGEHAGLGFLSGRVMLFPQQSGLKVPHTGWNQLWPQRASPLLQGIRPGAYAYFNHAYYCAASRREDVLALTDYGLEYASAIQRYNLFGVQFHPEKSQALGLRILENFLTCP
jgi:glutamine amidotransferase